VREIQQNTRIVVMGHRPTDGLCAIYLDETADREKAKHVVADSKVSRHIALLESLPLSLYFIFSLPHVSSPADRLPHGM
jgi:hypothetical protein